MKYVLETDARSKRYRGSRCWARRRLMARRSLLMWCCTGGAFLCAVFFVLHLDADYMKTQDESIMQMFPFLIIFYAVFVSLFLEPRGKQSNSTLPPLTKGDSSVQYSSSENQSRHVISCLSSSENPMLTTSLSS